MRLAREKLIFLALSVLMKWSDRATTRPVQPDISVRFALAFLFSCGKSGERRLYDEFWKLLNDPGLPGGCQNDYIRKTHCDSCIKGIITDVGAPHTPDYWIAIHQAACRNQKQKAPEI